MNGGLSPLAYSINNRRLNQESACDCEMGMTDSASRLEISGIASQFAIQKARFAIHNKLMHSKIANHLKKTISADI